jgi:hypothetical protein
LLSIHLTASGYIYMFLSAVNVNAMMLGLMLSIIKDEEMAWVYNWVWWQ